MADEHRRLRRRWPRSTTRGSKIMDPLTNRPMMIPPSGHVAGVWCRTDGTRGVHKAPANEVVMGANGLGFQVTHSEQGGLNKVGINCIRVLGPRHPHLGRPHPLQRSGVALHQRAPALQLRRGVDHGGHAVERVRAERRSDVELLEISASNFLRRVERRGAVRLRSEPGLLRQVRRGDQPARSHRGRAGRLRIGIAPVKPAEFVIFRLSQFTGAGAGAGDLRERRLRTS